MNKLLTLFNPDCEAAIANGSPYYMPSANIVKMAKDLAVLPCWIYGQDAVVLGKGMSEYELIESKMFISQMSELFNENFLFISKAELSSCRDFVFEPWGVTPRELLDFKDCKNVEEWSEKKKYMYSRSFSRDILEYIKFPFIPSICSSLDEIIVANDLINKEPLYRDKKYNADLTKFKVPNIDSSSEPMLCIAKAPWSSSGRGILQLSFPITDKEKEWLRGVLKKQGFVMLEHKFEKVYDFAMEFYLSKDEVKFMGLSEFKVGDNYEYKGNFVGNGKIIANRLMQYVDGASLSKIIDSLEVFLIQNIMGNYSGFLGIDMFVYKEGPDEFNVNPCVEINLRCNMGVVARMFSKKFLHKDNNGYFFIKFFSKSGEALDFHKQIMDKNKPEFKNQLLYSGYLNLTPVNKDTNFLAYVNIDK